MNLLAPAFLAGLLAIAIPVVIHMIHRERRETLAFPSLMFLRRIPYRSVRRQKIRHLLLLAVRCLAIAIVVAAFARPYLQRAFAAPAGASDSREVVILLDRSYSMGYGTRWDRATAAVRSAASGMRAVDRVTLVAFAASAAQVVEPTSDGGRVAAALDRVTPGSEPTRHSAGFRMASQILGASTAARKEIVLISDFHRAGAMANDAVPLPPGVLVQTVDVSRGERADVAVAHVALAREREGATAAGTRARATVTARLTNLGEDARAVSATLELAGRAVQTRRVTVPPRASAQVVFSPAPVAATAVRGVVSITPDSQPANDRFFFTVARDVGASVLIIEPPRARPNQSLFLARAWAVADDPAVDVEVRPATVVTEPDLRGRSLVVLNEVPLPTGARGAQLRDQVRSGAMLLIVPGEQSIGGGADAEWGALLPASAGTSTARAARWASADMSNALFEPFRAAGRGDFSAIAITRYRVLTPTTEGVVIARLDDGAPLLVERAVGDGRVLMWATSLDVSATNAPFHALWVPLTHQIARRSLAGRESDAWHTVPHALELPRTGEAELVVEAPSGERVRASATRPTVELHERGFYEVRGGATAIGAGLPVAVNVDLAESDLSHVDAKELVASITARETPGAAEHAAALTGTAQDLERQQAIWWYLLVGALLLLGAETILSNRLSRGMRQAVPGAS